MVRLTYWSQERVTAERPLLIIFLQLVGLDVLPDARYNLRPCSFLSVHDLGERCAKQKPFLRFVGNQDDDDVDVLVTAPLELQRIKVGRTRGADSGRVAGWLLPLDTLFGAVFASSSFVLDRHRLEEVRELMPKFGCASLWLRLSCFVSVGFDHVIGRFRIVCILVVLLALIVQQSAFDLDLVR
jgi:hypothetical protein